MNEEYVHFWDVIKETWQLGDYILIGLLILVIIFTFTVLIKKFIKNWKNL